MANATPDLTDEQLALLVQQGDKEKFGLLMDRYKGKLSRYGRRFLSNPDNIEDVVQEVFIKTYENIQSFNTGQRFSPWIYRIAHNTYVNALKKMSRGPLYFFDFDLLVPHLTYEDPNVKRREQTEILELLDKSLSKLNSNYREIITLYYQEDLSYQEIAEVLRIPLGTVGIRLKRAKEALRQHLSDYGH